MSTKMPTWLEKAIFYQIYPQSYYDSNGDGIGDIPGIIQKLNYIQSLGVTAIWLNPCFESPFQDAGYDVSNYYQVALRYGSNADLEHLFSEARQRGLRVILDLIPGHTSLKHPWFQQSQKAERNPYSDWYIWNDSVWSGSESDLPVTQGYAQRDAGYITNFFYFQPALNYGFAHPDPEKPWQQGVSAPGPKAVRQEIKNIMAFWLDKGASGFRVDMADSLVKGDPGKVATARFWSEIRKWLDKTYPEAVLISEWGLPAQALPAGFHVDMLLGGWTNPGITSLFRKRGIGTHRDPYGWSFFDESGHGDIRQFVDEYEYLYKGTKDLGFMGLITGNHDDHPRIADGRSMKLMKLIYLFLMTMPGTPFIYYGDEIGMTYIQDLPSKEGGYVRTGVRTPMQWTKGVNAGFSTASAKKLYLPINSNKAQINVASQESDPDSLLNRVRQLIALRQAYPALGASGSFKVAYAQSGKPFFAYYRFHEAQSFVVFLNPNGQSIEIGLQKSKLGENYKIIFNDHGSMKSHGDTWLLKMEPVSGMIFEIL